MLISKIFKKSAAFFIAIATFALLSTANAEQVGDWKVECKDKQGCAISQIIKDEQGDLGLAFIYREPKAENMLLLNMIFPLGVKIPAGVKLSVDGANIGTAPFTFCDKQGCNTLPIPLEQDTLNKIKAGNRLQIELAFGDKKKNSSFSLKGITKALETIKDTPKNPSKK
ncbi:MAG: invasion associated locus B family protein [Cardiobacteriaceae bacterium]|nr:invasion associated locus B family protein [Cardiobacteriaceae bacterium]